MFIQFHFKDSKYTRIACWSVPKESVWEMLWRRHRSTINTLIQSVPLQYYIYNIISQNICMYMYSMCVYIYIYILCIFVWLYIYIYDAYYVHVAYILYIYIAVLMHGVHGVGLELSISNLYIYILYILILLYIYIHNHLLYIILYIIYIYIYLCQFTCV